jgi:hypothetical protein
MEESKLSLAMGGKPKTSDDLEKEKKNNAYVPQPRGYYRGQYSYRGFRGGYQQQTYNRGRGETRTTRPTATGTFQPTCYTCNQKGHLARNCPSYSQPTCYNCNEKGHIARNCPKEFVH